MTAETVEFNPYLPEVHEDPYPLYHRLRAEDPVHRDTVTLRGLASLPVTFRPSGRPR